MKRGIDWNCAISRKRLFLELAIAAGLKPFTGNKLPTAFQGTFTVPVFKSSWPEDAPPWGRLDIVVKPGKKTVRIPQATGGYQLRAAKSSAHRTFVQCPCGREIPTGRYHQHVPSCSKKGTP